MFKSENEDTQDINIIDHKWLQEDRIALILESNKLTVGDLVQFEKDNTCYKIRIMRTLYDQREGNSVIGHIEGYDESTDTGRRSSVIVIRPNEKSIGSRIWDRLVQD